MQRIDDILESREAVDYLFSRGIFNQYEKARRMLVGGFPQKFDFKLRKPKHLEVYQFRINQKYRAIGFFRKENWRNLFLVTKISDHQE